MIIPGSYNASRAHRDLNSEIQRLHTQVLLSWEKEARTLAWFGLQNGMSVLELGSGPGFYTEKLLALLPNSIVTAVEIDPVLIERAKQYLQEKESVRLRIIEASIMDTGLPTNSFDFVVARLVFSHLPDPIGAAKEAFRVLKPGGKIVIIDLDGSIFGIFDPPIPELKPINEKFAQVQAAKGGNGFIGRRLWRILKAVGFQNLDSEAIVFHSDALGLEVFLTQFDPDQLLPLAKLGLLSDQEIKSFIVARKKFLASPNPFVLKIWLMACGKKTKLVN